MIESFAFIDVEAYGENACFIMRCQLPFPPPADGYVYLGCDANGLADEEAVERTYAVDGDPSLWVQLKALRWDEPDDADDAEKGDLACWRRHLTSYGFVEIKGPAMPYSKGWREDMRAKIPPRK